MDLSLTFQVKLDCFFNRNKQLVQYDRTQLKIYGGQRFNTEMTVYVDEDENDDKCENEAKRLQKRC